MSDNKDNFIDVRNTHLGEKLERIEKMKKSFFGRIHLAIRKLWYRFNKERIDKKRHDDVVENSKKFFSQSDDSFDDWFKSYRPVVDKGLDMSIFRENDMEDKFQEWLKDEDARKGNDFKKNEEHYNLLKKAELT